MADTAGIRAELGQAQADLASAQQEYDQLVAASRNANFDVTQPGQKEAWFAARRAASAYRTGVLEPAEARVSDIELQLKQAEATTAEAAPLGTASSGEVAAEEQQARSDDAGTTNPDQPPEVLAPEGRVDPADVQFGVDPPVVSTTESQSVSPNGVTSSIAGDPFAYDDAEGRPEPMGSPGVAAGNEDSGRNLSDRIIKSAFSGMITPQPNVLDDYPSYTYSISWYLLVPGTYKKLLESKNRTLQGFQLLAQSGGAPANTAGRVAPADPQELQQEADGASTAYSTAGRNPYFNLDYYIDNLEIESKIIGSAVRSAHNVASLKFTLTEPNGVTLLNNLYQAVNELYKTSNLAYVRAQYCLVIRFYGYDTNGNLVTKLGKNYPVTDNKAVIEKFYPFIITNLKFRLANKLVEYNIEGAPIPHQLGYTQNLGVIKAPIELAGATVTDVLTGSYTIPIPADDGRQTTPTPSTPVVTEEPTYRGDGRFTDEDTASPFQVGA